MSDRTKARVKPGPKGEQERGVQLGRPRIDTATYEALRAMAAAENNTEAKIVVRAIRREVGTLRAEPAAPQKRRRV